MITTLLLAASILSYENAYHKAMNEHRPLIVIVSMDNCPWCERQKAELKDYPHAVVAVLNKDRANDARYLTKVNITSFPTTYIFRYEDGRLLAAKKIVGYKERSYFDSILKPRHRPRVENRIPKP